MKNSVPNYGILKKGAEFIFKSKMFSISPFDQYACMQTSCYTKGIQFTLAEKKFRESGDYKSEQILIGDVCRHLHPNTADTTDFQHFVIRQFRNEFVKVQISLYLPEQSTAAEASRSKFRNWSMSVQFN